MVVGEIAEEVDLLIVGGGPGGYTAALRAAQMGRRVTIVDAAGEAGLGGACLHVGCIPSKALIELGHAAASVASLDARGLTLSAEPVDLRRFQSWKSGMVGDLAADVARALKGASVDVIAGRLRFTRRRQAVIETLDGLARFLQFRDVIIATGSRPTTLPGLPVDGKRVLDSSGALALAELPDRVAIVGGGYIGIEIGTALAHLGSAVTIVEAASSILPTLDPTLTRPVARRLRELGVTVAVGARVEGLDETGLSVRQADGSVQTVVVDVVVVAVGRRPNTDELGLDKLGVATDEHGLVAVGADRLARPHVGAIGDVVAGPALAHKAYAEAAVVVDALCGRPAAFAPAAIPAVVFSDPEVAVAGLSAAEAVAEGLDPVVATVPLRASGRARTVDDSEGFVRLVSDRATNAVIGGQIVGRSASELISQVVLAIEMAAAPEDVAATIHPHPTIAEELGHAAGRLVVAATGATGATDA